MKMIRAFAIVAAFIVCAPAYAQWQVPTHSVPIGKGGGFTGFNKAVPGAAGQPLVSNGAGVDPSFQALPNVLGPNDVYVNPSSGSDSNSCLTVGSPCLTFQHAVDLITQGVLYKNTTPNINLADGRYNEEVKCLVPALGAPTINVIGDPSAKTNVVLVPQVFTPPSGGAALDVRNGCNMTFTGVSFEDSAIACAGIIVFNGATVAIKEHVQFGSLTISPATGCGYHVLVDNNSIYSVEASDYVIAGSMTYHILNVGPSKVQWSGTTISVPNALTFNSFLNGSGSGASFNFDSTVICSGAGCAAGSTGQPYALINGASISPNNTVLPGASDGALNAGSSFNLLTGSLFRKLTTTTYSVLVANFPCNSHNAGVQAFIIDADVAVTPLTWQETITGGSGPYSTGVTCNGSVYIAD